MCSNDGDYVEPTILGKVDMEMYNDNIKRLDLMVAKKFEKGTPDDNRDIRVSAELIEKSNNALLKKAELNIKSKAQEDKAKTNGTVIELIRNSHIDRSNRVRKKPVEVDLNDDLVPEFRPVLGQMELGHVQLDIEDVIENGTVQIEEDDDEV